MSETSNKTVLDLAKDQGAVAIKLVLYASAYYSEAEYTEEIVLLTADYAKYIEGKVEIDPFGKTVISIPELDGKFSETEGEIDVEFITEDDLKNDDLCLYDLSEDGEYLRNYLFSSDSELRDQLKANFNEYYDKIDYFKTIKVSVRKSQIQQVRDFVNKLNNESGNE